ncbi:btb poz domain containing protein [Diplodia corticola]|uniref:Btb poz domain containing protein n=1 Tax=Diplodia corticola TaxID=236234 RepID=A0A1J9RZ23_9PEZI|nr:btb poz domain containing protein [Diplodia corticola]OJD37923.1 btb poz domain containing protein [Diplodia corticola]
MGASGLAEFLVLFPSWITGEFKANFTLNKRTPTPTESPSLTSPEIVDDASSHPPPLPNGPNRFEPPTTRTEAPPIAGEVDGSHGVLLGDAGDENIVGGWGDARKDKSPSDYSDEEDGNGDNNEEDGGSADEDKASDIYYRTKKATSDRLHNLTHLWILGDKLQMPALQNDTTKALVAMTATTHNFPTTMPSSFPTAEIIAYVYANTLSSAPLRALIVDLALIIKPEDQIRSIVDDTTKDVDTLGVFQAAVRVLFLVVRVRIVVC